MEEHAPFIKRGSSGNKSKPRLCLLLCCCVFLVLLVCLMIAAAIGLAVHFFVKSREFGTPISLQDILNDSFHALSFSGSFMSKDNIVFLTQDGLEMINVTDNTTRILVSSSVWNELGADYWFTSPSLSYLLLANNSHKLYRHSYTADYFVYQLNTSQTHQVIGSQWRVAKWTYNDELILVNESGLYFVADVAPNSTSALILVQAADGQLVGYPDWVYEEEILSAGSCVWPSEDAGPILAYLVFNSTGVLQATITEYGAEIGPFPSYNQIPYPRPGQQESTVQLKLVSTAGNITKCDIEIPTGYHYIQGVVWENTSLISVRFLDQPQAKMRLDLFDKNCKLVSTVHEYTTGGWVEADLLAPHFLSNGDVLTLLPQSNFTQVVRINSSSVSQVTTGHEVRSILAVYNSESVFYTTANYSYETNLYMVSLSNISDVTCVSCSLNSLLIGTELEERECKVASAAFSTDSRYFVLTCLGPTTPFSLLLNSSLYLIRVLQNNSALEEILSSYSLPSVEPFEFKDGNKVYYGTRMLSKSFSAFESHPVLLYVYGGPNSQLASLSHPLYAFSGFMAHLVSSLGFIVITVEGSGTCCRGQEFRFAVKNKLGVLEAKDQASLSHYLKSQSWVRSVSIMGASYGGYLSGMTSSQNASLAAAVVISPVTDWQYYDSVYTQRYMNTPQNNPQGYKDSSLLLRAGEIDGSKLLLIHGSADDNVHYQNSAEFSLHLKQAKQPCRMHTYFNENHHLRMAGTREDLYKLIESFLKEKSL